MHYWLVRMRGGEKVVESLCRLFPDADLFTHVYDPGGVSETIRSHRVQETFVGRLPAARTRYPRYLPLMPAALARLDLSDYDLVLSSEAGPAKGVRVREGSLHVCYCHTPMRYVWDLYEEYRDSAGPATRLVMPPLVQWLRRWDRRTAQGVDHFIANSEHVKARIRRHYGRGAEVIHPPVDTRQFTPRNGPGSYYLFVGHLVAYKRADLAVRAATRLGRRLIVVGDGEELPNLRAIAGPSVEFVGRQTADTLRDLYAGCRALLFPGEEDFGIVPVEAMACGRPVLALGRGGALETVVDGETGLFFGSRTEEALVEAILRFECAERDFDPGLIRARAERFDRAVFERKMTAALARLGLDGQPRET